MPVRLAKGEKQWRVLVRVCQRSKLRSPFGFVRRQLDFPSYVPLRSLFRSMKATDLDLHGDGAKTTLWIALLCSLFVGYRPANAASLPRVDINAQLTAGTS